MQAIASFRSVLSLSPGRGIAHYSICDAMLLKGDASARAGRDRAREERGLAADRPADGVSCARAQDGVRCRARHADREVREGLAPTTSPMSMPSAARPTRPSSGSTRRCNLKIQDSPTSQWTNLFDNIHSDPRWLPFLRKIGRAPEQLAKIQFKVTLPAVSTHPEERKLAAIMFTDMVVLKLLPSWGPASRRSAL